MILKLEGPSHYRTVFTLLGFSKTKKQKKKHLFFSLLYIILNSLQEAALEEDDLFRLVIPEVTSSGGLGRGDRRMNAWHGTLGFTHFYHLLTLALL